MENRYDFLEWLGPDTSTTVLMRLDDPADIARVSSVSRSWRRFVRNLSSLEESGSGDSMEWESLQREHRTYTSFVRHIFSAPSKREIMLESISASSTDNYPDESIVNTLEPSDQVDRRPSYWSSGGSRDPGAPETLAYRLSSKLCVIHEIKVRPFQETGDGWRACIGVCHVKVFGRSLYPKFDVDVLDTAGSSVLKYFPDATNPVEGSASDDEMREPSGWLAFAERIRQTRAGGAWNHVLLNALLGNVPGGDAEYDSGDELFE
ncbi:hypothetical protein Taro_021359 [Colocasia esculenta]|uniref:F-box protein n=1 Tax=Colocasia esculenta TaxID=4460 RepID=A0A843UYP2_COLES|nr:hypothetical protein [Colocasia esculenta]